MTVIHDVVESGFAQSFWAAVLAGAVILGLTYTIIEKRLHLRERRSAHNKLVSTAPLPGPALTA